MPTLMPFDAALEQEPRALGGRDVAGDQLDAVEPLAERLDRARHHHGMAVRDVDDDDVDAGAHELGRALEVVALGANRARRRAEPPLLVARRERQLPLVQQVLRGDEPEQRVVLVDERQLLDLAARASPLRPPPRSGVPRCTTSRSRGVMRDATVPCDRSTNRRSRVVSSPCSRPRLVDDDERADAGRAACGAAASARLASAADGVADPR